MGNKALPRTFNETLWTPKRQNGCGARKMTLLHVEVKETCGINYPRSKPHFSPQGGKKSEFLGAIVGYKNLNKVFVPHVIPMAEGAIIIPRRSHAQTVRPRQWHITRGGHTIENEFQGGG